MVIKANAAMLLVAAGLSLVACNKKDSQVKPNGLPKAAATSAGAASSVAVVDIDTLAAKSEYCKDGQKELENKQEISRTAEQQGTGSAKRNSQFPEKDAERRIHLAAAGRKRTSTVAKATTGFTGFPRKDRKRNGSSHAELSEKVARGLEHFLEIIQFRRQI